VKNIVIITSDSIRHNYFKTVFSHNKDINILRSYVESTSTFELTKKKIDKNSLSDLADLHLIARHNTEYDFFSDTIEYCEDRSNSKIIKKGDINKSKIVDEIVELAPDLIVTYGCSIIKSALLDAFRDRIINVHLGLSPYYFGSGTNFHCLVNNEFQFEGYTFMYMDEGIDTGKVIHQARAEIFPFDNPHQIGNRLIKQMTRDFIKLIANFELVEKKDILTDFLGKTYKNKDATDESTHQLYNNFANGAVVDYLKNKDKLLGKFPIVEQNFLKNLGW